MKVRKLLPYAALFVVAVTLDQWIKAMVENGLSMHERVDLLPFLALYRTYNTGIAFSLFSWLGDIGLIAIAVVVVGFVLFLASKTTADQRLARTGFTLVIGGALGNLIDRVLYGHVIDYVLFHTPVWSFAIFNLADAFITLGAVLVVLDELLAWRRQKAASPDD